MYLPNVSSDLVFSHSVKEVLKSIVDYLIKKVQNCQKSIQVLSSLTPSESNLFNTDSFLQNLLHEMETVFLNKKKVGSYYTCLILFLSYFSKKHIS